MSKYHAILPAVTLAVIAIGAVTAPKASAQQIESRHGEDSGSFLLSQQWTPAATSGAQVADAVRAARSRGDLDLLHGEDSGSVRLSPQPMPMAASRAQVADAVRAARSHGEHDALHGEDSGSFLLSAMPVRRAAAPSLFAGPVAD